MCFTLINRHRIPIKLFVSIICVKIIYAVGLFWHIYESLGIYVHEYSTMNKTAVHTINKGNICGKMPDYFGIILSVCRCA